MDARTSRYHDIYAHWQRRPGGVLGGSGGGRSTGSRSRRRFSTRTPAFTAAGSPARPATPATTRSTVTCSPGATTRPALIYDSPVTNTVKTFTYGSMLSEVQLLGAMLRDFGVEKGDRVIIYMPMVPEAVFAMLACARIGAIHSVVFGGFAAKELATRINDCKPKVILSASCGIEGARVIPYKPLLDDAINLAKHKPQACMILQRPQCEAQLTAGRDHDWRKVWENAVNYAKTSECVPVAATDPLYILYTSGTTGIPKGVVRDNGGHMVALKWSMQNLYGISPGEVWWSGSDVGWVVGHSLHCLRAAVPRLHDDPLRRQAGRHARRRRVLARDFAARCGGAVHGAHRLPCDHEGRSRTANSSGNTTCRNSARCFWPANAPTLRPSNGRRRC